MYSNDISSQNLVDILNAYSLNPQYVFDRIYKGKDSVVFFEKPQNVKIDRETICFITCFNKKVELDEMNAWIDRLDIPDGMAIEKKAIEGAKSMCAGYNDAMHSSKAKYKVYLHQDVRILNPYFIYEIVDCFNRNSQVGLIGMLGALYVPNSGVMWQADRVGAVVHSVSNEESIAETFDERVAVEGDCQVKLIDGFLMATCVDLNWRADIFKGWDFYDVSQSLEFIKKGYDVVVPYQKNTWCLHDFGSINWSGYEENRVLFVDEYLNDYI
ncbi:MAG: glycosyltransferase family protein [Butyrivibrio sp.]|nr:glycosyltransferase family protein [Butyrivibrio sp.]